MSRVVILPALTPAQTRQARAAPAGPCKQGSAVTARVPGGTSASLAELGDGLGGKGFHKPLLAETMRYAGRCAAGTGTRDDDAEIKRLRDAVLAAPCRESRSPESVGTYASDDCLRGLIESAFDRVADDQASAAAIKPQYPMPTQTVANARLSLAEHIHGFVERSLTWNLAAEHEKGLPEWSGIMTAVGTGKSTEARQAVLLRLLRVSRAVGGKHRARWLVPYHRLLNETLAEMKLLGINAAVMRGRAAGEPGTEDPVTGKCAKTMCRSLEAVKAAEEIYTDIEAGVCGSAQPGKPCCPFRRPGPNQCPFYAQQPAVAKADVVIAAHQALFNDASAAIKRDMALTIIDEGWFNAGLFEPRHINLAGLADDVRRFPVRDKASKGAVVNQAETAELVETSSMAEAGFTAHGDGASGERHKMLKAGLTGERCSRASAIEWNRMIKGNLTPGEPETDRKDALVEAAGNGGIYRRVAMWIALQQLLEGEAETSEEAKLRSTGHLQLGVANGAEGTRRTVILHSRREIATHVANLPMLLLDATLPLPVVRQFLPRLELLADVNPVAPYATYRQVTGGWGITSLCPNPKAPPGNAENKRRAHNVRLLSDFVALHSKGAPWSSHTSRSNTSSSGPACAPRTSEPSPAGTSLRT